MKIMFLYPFYIFICLLGSFLSQCVFTAPANMNSSNNSSLLGSKGVTIGRWNSETITSDNNTKNFLDDDFDKAIESNNLDRIRQHIAKKTNPEGESRNSRKTVGFMAKEKIEKAEELCKELRCGLEDIYNAKAGNSFCDYCDCYYDNWFNCCYCCDYFLSTIFCFCLCKNYNVSKTIKKTQIKNPPSKIKKIKNLIEIGWTLKTYLETFEYFGSVLYNERHPQNR